MNTIKIGKGKIKAPSSGFSNRKAVELDCAKIGGHRHIQTDTIAFDVMGSGVNDVWGSDPDQVWGI